MDLRQYDIVPCLNGSELKKIYFEMFKEFPNTFWADVDLNNINIEKFRTDIREKYMTKGSYEVHARDSKGKMSQYTFIDEVRQEIMTAEEDCVTIFTRAEKVDPIVNEILKACECTEKETGFLSMVTYCDGEYDLVSKKIKKTEIDIDLLYNDDFKETNDSVFDFINNQDNGLAILHGGKGTGKTSYIRHLINNTDKHFILINNRLIESLADPQFIDFIMGCVDSILILEDCEQAIMDRSINSFGNSISNLLNMSDGLMSDLLKLRFICTFNTDLSNIDPALLRKGRCKVKYEFKELSSDKVKKLSEVKGLNIPEDKIKKMTLADIFNFDKDSFENKQGKIGFVR